MWFAVVATPLAGSKPSYPDSPKTPETARSVYVILYAAARPPHQTPPSMIRGLLRPTSTLQESWHKGHPLLQGGARSMGRGFRVGVVVSMGHSFVGNIIFSQFSYPRCLFKVIGDVDFLGAMEVVE